MKQKPVSDFPRIDRVVLGATRREFRVIEEMDDVTHKRFQADCKILSNSESLRIVIDSFILDYLNIIHLQAENEEQAQFARDAINVIIKLEEKISSHCPSEEVDSDENNNSII